MKLRVVIHEADEGGYWAEVPALSGCVSQGESLDEVRQTIRETAEGWLAVADDQAKTNDETARVEVVEV